MKTPVFSLLAALALAGCATPFRAPSGLADMKLERVDSPLVRVEKIWLERKSGPLVVAGYVVKRLETEETGGTHLDVTLYNEAGQVLRTTVEHFAPREIQGHPHRQPYASYRVALDPLPAGSARIEVRAHEGPHT